MPDEQEAYEAAIWQTLDGADIMKLRVMTLHLSMAYEFAFEASALFANDRGYTVITEIHSRKELDRITFGQAIAHAATAA